MEAIVRACCGLDVHQATVVACLLVGDPDKKPRREVRTFGTMTCDLIQMRECLTAEGCTHVGMESTGVYWMPVYAMLEGHFELVVGNATHIKNVPGRKTDVKDSEWIADLLRHGLIRRSFVPPKPLRELRDLLRYRRKLVEAQTAERNRLLKLLETANIKLASVASDVFGVSGRAMLRALLGGTATPDEMAQLARGSLRKKIASLSAALDGRVEEHHRFLLGVQLDRMEQVEASITKVDARIDEKLLPYATQHQRLTEIPGVDRIGAAVIIAELGVDMSVFPTPPPGPASAPATTRAQASGRANPGVRETSTSRPRSCRQPWAPDGSQAPISKRSSGVSRLAAAQSGQLWPSRTRSSSPPTTCSGTTAPTRISGWPISIPSP